MTTVVRVGVKRKHAHANETDGVTFQSVVYP